MRLHENVQQVTGLVMTVPSTTTPQYISVRDYRRVRITIKVKNATTVTGSAITLKQATAIAGTGEKPLAFTEVYANTDLAADPQALTKTAVTNNTFTTANTDSKNLKYVIEVEAASLDTPNGFDCLRVGTGNATAATVDIEYLLYDPRYKQESMPSAIVD